MPSEVSRVSADQPVEELRRELAEAREQLVATCDILRLISSSPTDLARVFDTILINATRLCEGNFAGLWQYDGEALVGMAQHNLSPGFAELCRNTKIQLGQAGPVRKAALERRTIHVADITVEPGFSPIILQYENARTVLAVPLLREKHLFGVVCIWRREVHPFTEQQIALVQTFADQAVIAIENMRLFDDVQTRTLELTESLEYQTAISEVLSVISRSPTDVQPVFDMIAQSAARLCRAQFGHVFRYDGTLIHFAAVHGLTPEGREALERLYPMPPGRTTAAARSILTHTAEEIPDVRADSEYAVAHSLVIGFRSVAAVPMLKDGHPIGAVAVLRSETGRFPERQIQLLKTFADQAVIAIENTRLFEAEQASKRELQESLEYQTATSEVLGVISRSPDTLQPVLDGIVATALRLCDARNAAIVLHEGDVLRLRAKHGPMSMRTEWPVGNRSLLVSRAVHDCRTQHVHDLSSAGDEFPEGQRDAIRDGIRSILAVPLVREERSIGTIVVRRTEVKPFTDRQMALLQTFADQAVIAINNVGLFEEVQARTRELTERTQELTEALEYQTATSDVLAVISRSKFDLEPVIDTLVQAAGRLCDADAWLFRRQGNAYGWAASYGFSVEQHERIKAYFIEKTFVPDRRGMTSMRAAFEGRPVHILDVLADPDYTHTEAQAVGGFRTTLGVPLLRDGVVMGVLALTRSEVRPFTDKQIELITTFADQAVIAIENTRLFEEVRARTGELAKTVEELEITSQHKSQFVANMSHELRTPLAAILGYAELIQEGFYEPQGPKSLDALTRIRSNGKHLLGLINTVLDIAKIESGQFTLNMAEYAIESIVETVRSATESLAQNKKLALKTEVAKSLPVGFGDEQRLTQVLLNLVGNAIKFTDAGEVRVTAKAVKGHFNVSVVDTGPGIPEHERTRIFEQFHQVDSSLTKAAGGTGLGLAIAKQIVEMHGGRIWVESTLGKGSTFQIELPTRAELRKRAP
jgi:two-component system NtrC family sensor kinase